MSENVGLSTPRGSGTSGYVQRNLAHVRPRDRAAPYPRNTDSLSHKQRQPDKAILEHDRKREIEVKVFELRDRLEDEELEQDKIKEQCDELRKKLVSEMNSGSGRQASNGPRRQFKEHQVHAMADAKIQESERLRKALHIGANYEEGSHWKKQDERLRESLRQDEDEAKSKREDGKAA